MLKRLHYLLPLMALLPSCNPEDDADIAAATPCIYEAESACGPTKATVLRVIDGDTIVLDTENQDKVRMLLVDTPESVNVSEPDCYGIQAKDFTKSLLKEGATVYLEYDQKCTEKYGRLLAYICYNGTMVNRTLVERGYAKFYPYDNTQYKYRDEFEQLEAAAKEKKAGLWGACYY